MSKFWEFFSPSSPPPKKEDKSPVHQKKRCSITRIKLSFSNELVRMTFFLHDFDYNSSVVENQEFTTFYPDKICFLFIYLFIFNLFRDSGYYSGRPIRFQLIIQNLPASRDTRGSSIILALGKMRRSLGGKKKSLIWFQKVWQPLA